MHHQLLIGELKQTINAVMSSSYACIAVERTLSPRLQETSGGQLRAASGSAPLVSDRLIAARPIAGRPTRHSRHVHSVYDPSSWSNTRGVRLLSDVDSQRYCRGRSTGLIAASRIVGGGITEGLLPPSRVREMMQELALFTSKPFFHKSLKARHARCFQSRTLVFQTGDCCSCLSNARIHMFSIVSCEVRNLCRSFVRSALRHLLGRTIEVTT